MKKIFTKTSGKEVDSKTKRLKLNKRRRIKGETTKNYDLTGVSHCSDCNEIS